MSRWKLKKRGSNGSCEHQGAGRRSPIQVVEMDTGFGITLQDGPKGWMSMETYEKRADRGKRMQIYGCPKTGELWVKSILGRYRGKDEESLSQRLRVLEEVAACHGGSIALEGGPLWMQVEFIENVLEVRMRPPCGCPPCRSSAAA